MRKHVGGRSPVLPWHMWDWEAQVKKSVELETT
jgi:hypothetical protein